VQAKGICSIVNKLIAENLPNHEQELPISVQGVSRTPNRLEQKRVSLWHINIKTISTKNRERILKAVREKKTK
jgi:hypothetical protein